MTKHKKRKQAIRRLAQENGRSYQEQLRISDSRRRQKTSPSVAYREGRGKPIIARQELGSLLREDHPVDAAVDIDGPHVRERWRRELHREGGLRIWREYDTRRISREPRGNTLDLALQLLEALLEVQGPPDRQGRLRAVEAPSLVHVNVKSGPSPIHTAPRELAWLTSELRSDGTCGWVFSGRVWLPDQWLSNEHVRLGMTRLLREQGSGLTVTEVHRLEPSPHHDGSVAVALVFAWAAPQGNRYPHREATGNQAEPGTGPLRTAKLRSRMTIRPNFCPVYVALAVAAERPDGAHRSLTTNELDRLIVDGSRRAQGLVGTGQVVRVGANRYALPVGYGIPPAAWRREVAAAMGSGVRFR